MRFHPVRLAILLSPLLAATACTSLPWPINWLGHAPREDLDSRLQMELAPELAAGRVSLRHTSDGTSVTFADQAVFAPGGADLNETGHAALTSVIQALIDPNLLHIEVAEATTTPASLQAARVQTVTGSFDHAGLAAAAQPPVAAPPMPANTPVEGLTITVRLIPG
jgi:hypothetical protein